MIDSFTNPVEAINAVLQCTQASLGRGSFGVPETVVTGGLGAGDAYNCCSSDNKSRGGLLTIEWEDAYKRDDGGTGKNVSGLMPCDVVWQGKIVATVFHCVQTFAKGGGLQAVDPKTRTTASLANLKEAWDLLNDLTCCAREWGAEVQSHRMLPPAGGCFGHEVTLTLEVRSDCGCC